jgi:hypothetical protein
MNGYVLRLAAVAGLALQPLCAQTTAATQPLTRHGEAPELAGTPARPKAGPVATMPSALVKPGMRGVAWTVFQGTEPEPVPVEVIGLWKNVWGPKQDIILAKLGGKAAKTSVAGGMSGSPVYIDGRLVGAISLRIGQFSPDAICGITPIEQMLEIKEIDMTRPPGQKTPQGPPMRAEMHPPAGLLPQNARLVPIETPLAFGGFSEASLRAFGPVFEQMGITPVQGGAAGNVMNPSPAAGWQSALQPGQAIAGMLVSGDLSVTGLGTVTYNDGKRVLGFGHSFFNLGPLSMPMSKGEVLMVLSSQFQPNKIANATEVVGALRQDRHSGILGVLGEMAETIPVTMTVKSPGAEKKLQFRTFVHPKWTPFLMTLTVFNTLQDLNAVDGDNATFTLDGLVDVDGAAPLKVRNMVATTEMPMPAPMTLATWWGDRFNRLFLNSNEVAKVKKVDVSIQMDATRRTVALESAWLDRDEVTPGGELSGRVFVRPWRGERTAREFKVKVPAGLPKGEYRLLLSDADLLNRSQSMVGSMNRNLDIAQQVSMMNQERPNNQIYISIVEARPTVYQDDKALTALPGSILNALQSRPGVRPLPAQAETATVHSTLPLDEIVTGNATLRFSVK